MKSDIHLPLIGSKSNRELFEFLLLQIHDRSALISIPLCLKHGTFLEKGEKVNLHLRKLIQQKHFNLLKTEGNINLLPSNKKNSEYCYKVIFDSPLKIESREDNILSPQENNDKLISLIKDSLLLKNGIYIYLKHFVPYLSRMVTIHPSHYKALKLYMFNDIQNLVLQNLNKLEKLYNRCKRDLEIHLDTYIEIDLDQIKELCYSEIDPELLNLALTTAPTTSLNTSTPFIAPQNMYINAIKLAEERLYENYNTIVELFIASSLYCC